MKKIFLLTILLFQLTIVFGQNAQWENWQAVSCYKGFQTSSISYGFNKHGNGYEWNWKVKSNYNKNVSFNLAVTIGNDKKDWGRFTLSPGDEHKHVSFYYNNASPNIKIEITKVCFSDNYLDNCWAECDNGTPNQPNCDKKTNSSNSNSSSNTTTTKQNDLSEYNRSKADLERQIADKNAEGQAKSQNYITAMNAGISAHNSGNYTEAKRQFSIALNNCNTEEARLKAQQYYDKTVGLEKDLGKIQAVGDMTTTLIMGIGEISEERKRKKQEEENKKREEEEESEKYKNDLDKDISDAKNGVFDAQISMGGRCFDAYLFEPAEKYYLKAFKNINKSEEKFLKMKLITVLSINGKKENLLNLISNDTDNFLKEMLILNNEKYFRNSIITDSLKQNSINTLKKISKYNKDAAVTIAYYQITGEYENLKVEKDIESGLKELNYYTTNYKNNLSRTNSLAHYYMGMLYLKGYSGIKVNKAKAIDYFINSIEISDYKIKEKKDLINMPQFSIYVNYFDGAFLSYIQATSVLSDSSKMDKEIVNIMKQNISKYYVNLVSLNFQELFSIK